MINKKLTKKEKNIISNINKEIEKEDDDELKNVGKAGGIVFFICMSVLVIFAFFENKLEIGHEKTQNGLFCLSFAIILYNLIISIFTVNFFKEYKNTLIMILNGNFDYKDSLNQLVIANISNLTISILVLIFVVDWSLWGGYKVKIGTTLSIFFIFTVIEIIKMRWKSKFKK